AGSIVAIKGLGGFHLVCDASRADAVARLRQRKAREEKPFAVLLANLESARIYAEIDTPAAMLLTSAERPVVLLRKHSGCDARLSGVAPGLAWLGVMLPSTPIHYLLFHEAEGRPAGRTWLDTVQPLEPLALVATSANPGGEPLVTGNAEALARLAGIADAYLLHDRDIVVRCDDSVLRFNSALQPSLDGAGGAETPQFIRRARGYTPRAIKLANSGPAVLAFGGWYKNTLCVTRGNEAFVSQHIGDLDNAATCNFHEESVARLLALLEIAPEIVACDLHPDFHSSRTAAGFAAQHGLRCIPVQHHHAHIAAVLAEHGHDGPALGLALDGVGLVTDGGAWGGELL
ncbi:MAG: Sua5/YciO/YrdC/YwlC family protein, partial [Pseudomonadota bacterium]